LYSYYIISYIVCQLPMTSFTRRRNLLLPDDGQDIWSKHVAIVYNTCKTSCAYLVVTFVSMKTFVAAMSKEICSGEWKYFNTVKPALN
jgi:hypothetical protein